MSHLLSCANLSKSFGVRPLFDELSLTIHEGEQIGLIGPNGAGKSTLLRVLAGIETADNGTILRRNPLRVAYLPQTDKIDPAKTVEQVLFEATEPGFPDDDRHARAGEILNLVGFEDGDQKAGSLSGGWRKRLAIATTLVKDLDLALWDEPTNHLDLEGILWLEQFLSTAAFSTIVISHDRAFLENATNRTIEISKRYPKGFLSVDGNYSEFLMRREDLLVQLSNQEQALANTVRREVEWLRRMPKARTTKSSARIERAEGMSADLAAARSRAQAAGTVNIDFIGTGRQSKQFIVAEKVSKRFGIRTIVKDLSFALLRGMRLGIVGPNGSGKSTILKMFEGTLKPDGGSLERAPALKIVTFDQQRGALDMKKTLRRYLAPDSDSVDFRDSLVHIASYAKRFRFDIEHLDTPISSLSGGEQARLLVAKLMLESADLLLLDEPTNDLDIDTLQVLEENLIGFPGAVVLITHDRFMIENVCTRFLAIEDGDTEFFSSYDQWREAQQIRRREKNREEKKRRAEGKTAAPVTSGVSPEEQKDLQKLEKAIERGEQELAEMEAEITKISANPADDKFTAACSAFARSKAAVEKLYERWQALEAKRG